jgi:hypothetical protein
VEDGRLRAGDVRLRADRAPAAPRGAGPRRLRDRRGPPVRGRCLPRGRRRPVRLGLPRHLPAAGAVAPGPGARAGGGSRLTGDRRLGGHAGRGVAGDRLLHPGDRRRRGVPRPEPRAVPDLHHGDRCRASPCRR